MLPITPNPTPSPSTQLTLVYNTYVYPHREEERDSKMGGFKLGVFYREARINRSTGELLLYDWSSTKSRLDPDSNGKIDKNVKIIINNISFNISASSTM